jgi:protein-tyrosine sulfotransferase
MRQEEEMSTSPQAVDPQAAFVLSCNRSGSTLLRFIIDTHPEIYSPPELFLGQAAHSMATFLSGLEGSGSFQSTEERFFVMEAVAEPIRTCLTTRMVDYAARKGKRLWCEKTPSNVFHLKLLDFIFPAAKHICLYRHGLDVVASAMQMAGRIGPIQKCIYQSGGHVLTGTIRWWCEMTREILAFECQEPDRCFRIRYEDLVTDPRKALPPLFTFLGVSWDDRLLDAVFSTVHETGHEDPNIRFTRQIHRDSLGTGASLPLTEVPDDALAEMQALLEDLGYPRMISRGSANSGPAAEVTMPWFFEQFLPERLETLPDLAASINTSFRFAVDGPGGGSWILDLYPDRLGVRPENGHTLSTVMISATDLAAISQGALNARKAFSQGRLRLAGNVSLDQVQKLTQLLLQPSASENLSKG